VAGVAVSTLRMWSSLIKERKENAVTDGVDGVVDADDGGPGEGHARQAVREFVHAVLQVFWRMLTYADVC
jgi:hypothetical protein